MNIITLELVRTAVIAVILGVLIGAGRLRVDVAGRGWRLIFCAFVILFAASAFQVAEHFDRLRPSKWTSEYSRAVFLGIAFLFGVVLIGIELVRSITGALAAHRTRYVSAALTKVKTQLSTGQALLRGVLKGSLSGVVVVKAIRDHAGVVIDLSCELMNGAAAQILGRTSDDLLGQPLLRHIPAVANEGLFNECVSVIESGLPFNDERRYAFGGSAEWLQTEIVKLRDGCAITFTNITSRKQAEEQLRFAAMHDALTGLPNRAMFIDRLELALHKMHRNDTHKFAVLFFDFDRFKHVNDTFGHEVGDALLISIANRLRAVVGVDDAAGQYESGHLPARLGGDEFVMLLTGLAKTDDVLAMVKRFEHDLVAPHRLDGHEVVSTASIGIVICDRTYKTADDVVRDADTAMYEAKRAGRSCHVLFDRSVHRLDVVRERAA